MDRWMLSCPRVWLRVVAVSPRISSPELVIASRLLATEDATFSPELELHRIQYFIQNSDVVEESEVALKGASLRHCDVFFFITTTTVFRTTFERSHF
jgi:hypothetical protein